MRFFRTHIAYPVPSPRSISGLRMGTKTFCLRTTALDYWSHRQMVRQSKRAYAGRLLDHPLHPALDSLRIPDARRHLLDGGGGGRVDGPLIRGLRRGPMTALRLGSLAQSTGSEINPRESGL